MSDKHTPGRLRVKGTRIYADGAVVDCIATMQISNQALWDEDARRLVACWNSCDGISTDHLERHGLPDFTKKISDLREQHDDMQKQVAEIAQLGMVLREQRDELLAALRVFAGAAFPVANEINQRGYNWSEVYLDQALAIALAAMAKVKGGAA